MLVQNIYTADEIRIDEAYTMQEVGIPDCVLMEHAASSVAEYIAKASLLSQNHNKKILVVCGMGNNGGDGLAVARILSTYHYAVDIWEVGNDNRRSEANRLQRRIAASFPVTFCNKPSSDEYAVIVDAIFGIGLHRQVAGEQFEAIERMNAMSGLKIAVDIPSGIHTDTGEIMGIAFKADATITFHRYKRGLFFGEGKFYVGTIVLRDVSICEDPAGEHDLYTCDLPAEKADIVSLFPKRNRFGNKGTFGKLLFIGGFDSMAGAGIMACTAAFRSGLGMVKIISDPVNRELFQSMLPEAMFADRTELDNGMNWADVILIGPGLGRNQLQTELLESVIKTSTLPLILDADALYLLAGNEKLQKLLFQQAEKGRRVVMTPHIGELSKILSLPIAQIKREFPYLVQHAASFMHCELVAKDAYTLVCNKGKKMYLNRSGSSALSKAGSGDILSGILAGFICQNREDFETVNHAVLLHGCLGNILSEQIGEHICLPTDLLDTLKSIKI